MKKLSVMIRLAVASSAISFAIVPDACIRAVVSVSTWAIDTPSLEVVASPDVFRKSDRLQMAGINARRIFTEMIQGKTLGDSSDVDFIGDAVRVAVIPAILRPNHNAAVAKGRGRSKPQPTTAIRLGGNVAHQSFFDCYSEGSHVTPFKSHRSGSRGASNAVAGRSYYSAEGAG